MNPAVEKLLRAVENPVVEFAFVAAIRAGRTLIVECIPEDLLVPAFLLNTIAREWLERSLVDDHLLLGNKVHHLENVQEVHLLSLAFNGLPLATHSQATYVVNAYKELTGAFSNIHGRDYGKNRKKSLHTPKHLPSVAA